MCVKQLFLVTLLAVAALKPVASMSMEQMEKMSKNLRKSCLQKIDTTDAMVEGLRRGEFPDDSNLKCYTNCIMKLLRTYKNGQIDFDMLVKQVELSLPADLVPSIKTAINNCRNKDYTGDDCEKSYQYVQCHYREDSKNFMFP